MGRPQKTDLTPKHYKALELWEEGVLSIKEIAAHCDISLNTLYDLFEGNAQKAGAVAHLFKAELEKITTRTSSKVRKLVKDNKNLALFMMNDRLKVLKQKKTPTVEDTKEVVSIMNTLNKATPNVEIGAFNSMNFTKGMTPEELVYEFTRLKALANNSFNPKGIRDVIKRTEGRVSGPSGDGSTTPEE